VYIDAVLIALYTLSTCKDVDLTYVPATTDLASTGDTHLAIQHATLDTLQDRTKH